MAKFRVLLTDRAWPEADIERSALATIDAELVEPPDTSEATLCEFARSCDAIATNWAKVTAKVITAAERCRVVARTGIGIDNIAVNACTARRIPVVNCPDYCIPEVADHTWGLILGLTRNIGFFHHRTKQGEYALQHAGPMRRLAGRTLGLLGLGRIGSAVAQRAFSFGMNVIAHTSSGKNQGIPCEMVSRNDLWSRSDIISLHAPLTDATRKIVSPEAFQQMRSGAYLINTSRGGLIDEAALWDALNSGRLAGVAMDVFDPEPPDLTQPLFRDERVIVTPHAAFVSVESIQTLRRQAMENVVSVLMGGRPTAIVNPQVWID